MKRLIIIAGPSAGGKTTVAEELLSKRSELSLIRSVTTRAKRGDGKDGEYIYLDREEFLRALDRGDILEYMEYAGELYGTPRSELERVLGEGRVPLLILDLNGVVSLRKFKEYSSVIVYIHTDLDVCEERLYARYLASPSPKGLKSFTDRKERNIRDYLALPKMADYFDFFIDNSSTVEQAAQRLSRIFDDVDIPLPIEERQNIAAALAASARAKNEK